MPNKLPQANKVSLSGLEDQVTTIVLSGTDKDGTIASYTLASLPSSGALYLDAAHTTLAAVNVTYASNTFYFVPAANFSGSVSFNYSVTDNQGGVSPAAVVTVILAAVNDAPVVDLNGSDNGTSAVAEYFSTGAAIRIVPSATVADIVDHPTSFSNGSLRVAVTQSGTSTDQLGIATDATVTTTSGGVFVSGVKVGTIAAGHTGANGSDLVISLSNGATPASVSTLLQHISYRNSSTSLFSATRGVTVSLTDGGGTANGGTDTGSATATINIISNHVPTGTVSISGTVTEDQVLTASNTLADADGLGTIGYQWQRNGSNIAGATSSTYTLGDADVGASIRVVASYTDGHGTAESVTSAATGPVGNVNDAPTGTVSISGTVTEDQVLTASNTLADADGLGTIGYQWQRNGSSIAGATSSTYTLVDADVGASIRVVASYTDGHGTAESVTSVAVGPVGNVNDAPTGTVSISGTVTEDQVLTASNTLADADGLGTIGYQWQRNGSNIAGATSSTYTLGDTDVGASIRVVASYTDGHGTAESVSSAAVGPVVNVNDAPTGTVSISGTATEDQVLTASNTLADADGLGTIGYQWQRNGSNIAGATSSTYTLGDTDVGASIRVVASYTDGHGTAESVTSAATGPVGNVNDAPMSSAPFLPPVVVGPLLGPVAGNDGIAVGDVNGDGRPDVVAEVWDSDMVAVYISHGDGTFEVPAIYSNGASNYLFVGVGDLNNDGMPDIADPNGTGLAILLNNGDGTFGQATTIPNVFPAGVAIGDLNGDGNADVVLTNGGVSVLLGNGDGTFAAPVNYATAFGPFAIEIADVNVDGKPDLVVAGNHSNAISVLLGDGSGEYPTRTDYTVFTSGFPGHPTDVAIGDFNGDGLPDIVTANQEGGSNELAVLLNNGGGLYGTPIHISAPVNPAWGIGTADVNGDGKVDIVGPSFAEGLVVLPGNGNGTFGAALTYAGSGSAFDAVLSDFNGDGLLDVVFTASAGLSVMVGQALVSIAGTATEDQVLTASNTLADADGLGTIGYQWQRNGSSIAGATSSTYTLVDADVGASIRVVASYTDGHGTAESVTSVAVGPVGNVNDAPNVDGPVQGNATEDGALITLDALANVVDADGDLLSVVDVPDSLPAGVTFYISDAHPLGISDFTGISIPFGTTDGETHADFDGVWSVSAPPWPININNGIGYLINPSNPTDAYSLHDHQYIAPNMPDPSVAVATFHFALPTIVNSIDVVEHVNGVTKLHGYVGNSLDSLTDIGAVFGSLGDLTGPNQMFNGEHNLFNFTNSIAGTYFQVVIDKTSVSDGYALFRMFPQGVTAGSVFTLDPADAAYQYLGSGEHTTVTVNYAVSDGITSTAASASLTVTGVNDTPVSNSIANQSVNEGNALQFSLPAETFTDPDANDSLTFAATLTNGNALPGWLSFNTETQTFTGTPGSSQVGSLDVRITATDSQNSQASADFTLTVTNINDAPTGMVSISGTATEDQVLTASNTLADADGLGLIGYQWQRNGSNIAGATGSTYTLGDADVGASIRVVASYTDGHGTAESVSSAAVGPVVNVNDAPVVGGGFSPPTFVDNGYPIGWLAVADVNGDGKADLLTETYEGNEVSIYRGNGDGSFLSRVSYLEVAAGGNYVFMAVGDLNGDGKPDIAVPNGGPVNVLLNNGDGTFGSPAVIANAVDVVISDFNGDGKNDVALTNDGVAMLLGNGDGTFGAPTQYATAYYPFALFSADVNGDGAFDLIVGEHGANAIGVLLGHGDGTFAPRIDYTAFQGGGAPFSLAVADLTGDDRPDIVVTNQVGGSNELSILINNGDGTFAAPERQSLAGGPGDSLGITDANGDGIPDILVPTNAGLDVFLGDGTGNFTQGPLYTATGAVHGVTISDVDGDGVSDIVLKSNNNLYVMLGGHAVVTEDGPASTIDALANASDVDDGTTLSVVNVPANLPAGVSYNAATHSFTLDPSNAAYQHLAQGQTTTVTVNYGVSDGIATTPDRATWTINGANDAPTVSDGVTTATDTSISFTASDVDNTSLALTSPFAGAFGSPTVNNGSATTLTPTQQASAASGTLQVSDGTYAADVVGLYLGTGGNDTASAPNGSLSNAMYGFGGNDTLTGSSNADTIVGGSGDDTLIGGTGADTLNGGTGNDFASYSNAATGVTASLTNPAANTGDAAGDVYIAIERLEGSAFDDTLTGDTNSNSLRGGGGADVLDGQAGIDTASYFYAATGISASLANPASNMGEAAGDSYISIENLSGSAFADTLTGDAADNTLLGNGGADILNGGTAGFDYASYLNSSTGVTASIANPAINTGEAAGDTYISIEGLQGSTFSDTLIGNSSSNTLISNSGGDTLIGGAGSDTFFGGPGSDTFYGNSTQPGSILDGSTDTVDYSSVTGLNQGIGVNWAAGTVVGQVGIIDTDHLIGIEDVFGTAFDDVFDATGYSSALANAGDFSAYQLVRGGGGNDIITGNITGNFGSTGTQTEALYSDATSGITANMSTTFGSGTVTGGGIGTDTLAGVNRIVGSNFNDTFFGSDNGNEIFDGYTGGDDVFHGGGGIDKVEYDSSNRQAIAVDLANGVVTGRVVGSNIGTDTLDSIENIRGSELDDLYDATGFSASSTNHGSSGTFNQFEGQGGADSIMGNNNTAIAYFNASAGITVTMSGTGTGSVSATYGGNTAVDTFSGVGTIFGSNFADAFAGSAGADNFQSQSGNDTLTGNGAGDTLTGGAGNDTFNYAAVTDSQAGAFDTITDFVPGQDKIDLSALVGLGNTLTTVVSAPANIAANSLVAFVSAASTILYANTSAAPQAAASASMEIHLTGVSTLANADIFHHA